MSVCMEWNGMECNVICNTWLAGLLACWTMFRMWYVCVCVYSVHVYIYTHLFDLNLSARLLIHHLLMQYIIINIRIYTYDMINRYPLSGPRLCVHSVSFSFFHSFIHLFVRICAFIVFFFVAFHLKFCSCSFAFLCFLWVCVLGGTTSSFWLCQNQALQIFRQKSSASLLEPQCPHYLLFMLFLLLLPFCTIYLYFYFMVFSVLIVHKPKTKLILVESIAGFALFFST